MPPWLWADEGRTVVVSSHLLAEVAQVVDRVVIIRDGALITEATMSELTGSRVVMRVDRPERSSTMKASGTTPHWTARFHHRRRHSHREWTNSRGPVTSLLAACLLLGTGSTNQAGWLITTTVGMTALTTSAATVAKLAWLESRDRQQAPDE